MVVPTRYTGLPEGVSLNPVQEVAYPHKDTYDSVLVCAHTGTGKSQFIPMFGDKHLQEGKKILYVGIMKALAEEKLSDWEEKGHPWENLPKAAITGDYAWNDAMLEEVGAASLIVMTPECLLSRLINFKSPKSKFLRNVGLIVLDEVHLIGSDGRGGVYEAAVIAFSKAFPDAQILALSATVPNRGHFAQWFEALTGRDTLLIESDYRAVPVEDHYLPYRASGDRRANYRAKIDMICELVSLYPDEQFLVCVWSKSFGYEVKQALLDQGVSCEFHNANYSKDARAKIEKAFKRGGIRVLVSTSTLFTGVNLPARNLIVTEVEVAKKDIPVYEIMQAAGRAGRPRYDDLGRRFYIIPQNSFVRHKARLQTGEDIVSRLTKREELAAHVLGAVYSGYALGFETLVDWYTHTLAYVQNTLTVKEVNALLDNTVKDLVFRGMMVIEDNGIYRLSAVGKIAAQMLLDPYHFYDLLKNCEAYCNLTDPNSVDAARAFACCHGFRADFATKQDLDDAPNAIRSSIPRHYLRMASVVYWRITGAKVPSRCGSESWQAFDAAPRWGHAITRAAEESNAYRSLDLAKLAPLFFAVRSSVTLKSASLRLKGYTNKQIRALSALGVNSVEDLDSYKDLIQEALGK